MLRLFIPLAFAVLFLGWLLYRLFVKKDLKQQLNTLYFGFFFFGVWALVYWFILSK